MSTTSRCWPTRFEELGSFVRRRRERLQPQDVGIDSGGGRRRAQGLRREELSHAAGVGLTWLTWLEQGREINVSGDVLNAISAALRLNDDERTYVFALAGLGVPKRTMEVDELPEHITKLVDAIEFPACVINYRLDVPYLNASGTRFFLYDEKVVSKNAAYRVYLEGRYRALFPDIDDLERLVVGIFRLGYARHSDDETLRHIISDLSLKSPRFAKRWEERHVIHPAEQGVVEIHHPGLGAVRYRAQTLMVNEDVDVSIYVAIPLA